MVKLKCPYQPLWVHSNGCLEGRRRYNVHSNHYMSIATGHQAVKCP